MLRPLAPARLSFCLLLALVALFTANGSSQTAQPEAALRPTPRSRPHPAVAACARCIRAHEEFLASDALNGRGSGSRDEWISATYVGAQLRAYGIEPAGDDGGYVQRATLLSQSLTGPPVLTFTADGKAVSFTHGKEMRARRMASPELSGPLVKFDSAGTAKIAAAPPPAGSVVLLTGKAAETWRDSIEPLLAAGVAAILVSRDEAAEKQWQTKAPALPELPVHTGVKGSRGHDLNLFELGPAASAALAALPDETTLRVAAPAAAPETTYTWNAVGILRGRSAGSAILLSAHLDHLGEGEAVNGDRIYNGADDDASGTTAVLELARVLGAGPRPRRTVVFALFGSEELGGLGSTWFREHPPVPLKSFAANLEFEMIGNADSAVDPGDLWLTGWERSNLGPALAQHGARLVADPHPAQHFFERSDNFVLAQAGVVAQTVSSYGLHKRYHQPNDDVAHLDFNHMTAAIGSLLAPVEWLANSDFVPRWNPGKKP